MRKLTTGNGEPPKDKPNKKPDQAPPLEQDDFSQQDTGNGNPPPDQAPR